MKIVHVMQREKFTKPISGFYDTFFQNGEHEIWYVSAPGTQSQVDPQLTIRQQEVFLDLKNKADTCAFLRKLAKEYDYIVMHALFYPVAAILANPRALKKLVWIAWGYDLYGEKKHTGFKKKLSEAMFRLVKSNCCAFVGIFPPDCDYYRKRFPKSRARVFYAPYISGKAQPKTYSPVCSLDLRRQDGEPVYIQVGHSAVESMNHIQALNRIAKYKNENIRVLLPLSYGNMAYGARVQKQAEAIFGEKAICLQQFLPKDEYLKILERVDIGIFQTHRQVALGNLLPMVFQNKKLYLPRDSVMYRYFHDCGVPVQSVESLDETDFDQLVQSVSSHDRDAFADYLDEYTSLERKIDRWRVIYEDLRKGLKA